jgi:hypothetical protein
MAQDPDQYAHDPLMVTYHDGWNTYYYDVILGVWRPLR